MIANAHLQNQLTMTQKMGMAIHLKWSTSAMNQTTSRKLPKTFMRYVGVFHFSLYIHEMKNKKITISIIKHNN
jgi:hypothetical protein